MFALGTLCPDNHDVQLASVVRVKNTFYVPGIDGNRTGMRSTSTKHETTGTAQNHGLGAACTALLVGPENHSSVACVLDADDPLNPGTFKFL